MTAEKKPIPTNLAMMLRPAENGGWVIESIRDSHLVPSILGAFTTPAGMLAALQQSFYPEETVEPSSLMKAADNLCFHAQTTGGTAGRDDGLVSAIEQYNAAREQHTVVPAKPDPDRHKIKKIVMNPVTGETRAAE